MSHRREPRQTVRVTLSPREGQELLALLNQRIEQGDLSADLPGVSGLLDTISDANALAVWLREYVNIEPDARQIALLQEVLDTTSPTSETNAVLAGIRSKLAQSVPA